MVRENKTAWKANYFLKVVVSIFRRSDSLPTCIAPQEMF